MFVSNGASIVDALSAGPTLFQEAAPLILVNTGQSSLPSAALEAMAAVPIQRVVIVGGPAAVSPAPASDAGAGLAQVRGGPLLRKDAQSNGGPV
ncbi:MAG: cell wall-binding repeat-containing protein [Firmicutes bacterium]|nr:cell wall-binding repeat-containing protein [Alicyclobacillaceae bacterium]MCL6497591.1 cell wall-binding repeat-containing protein [Bacillota bacterium]